MQVTVPRPDVKGRKEILNWYLSKIKVDPGTSPHRLICYIVVRPVAKSNKSINRLID